MPSIHPSFFFPLCWLPSPVHDHYFNTSHECKSSARIQLHQLYCSQLNELKELKQKAQKVLDYCDDDSDVVMKDQASTGNSNQMSVNSSTGQGLSNRNLNSTIASSIHERKQPSFNDEDFVSLQEFLSKSNDEMTWEEIQKMKQSESISVNIRSNQSGAHQSDNNGHVAQERSTAHHHHNHHHSKSHTLPSTDWVQNVKIIEKEMKWAARYQPHRIPMERGIWLKLDSLLLREREENTQLVQNQSSKSSTSSQDFENGKRGGGGQVEASPEACTGFKKNFQMALRLIESENELAVDQFDLVVQLCTKMIYSVVTQSPLCCPKWELENELNSVANISTEKKVNNNLPQYMLSRIHKTILRKSEEIYWRKFIEIIFLKLIVDPKCIVVGLSYFEKVVSLLENERVSSPLLKGAQHDGSNKDHSLRNSFNRNELKTIMCICVMLSSKMYDEDNYWKSKTYFKLFSSLCRKREDHKRITFKEFNQLEVEILNVLQFDLTLDMDAFGRRIVQRFLKVHFDEESALLMI